MTIARKWVLAAVVAGALVGGAFGGAAFSAADGNAASSTPATTTAAGPSGTFKPNENAAHEAGESPQREAQEDAGQFPTVP